MINSTNLLYIFLSFFIAFLFAVPSFLIYNADLNLNTVTLRIIGGKNAPSGKYPYMVSLKIGGEHFCGGSILNERWILTAGHCIEYVEHYFYAGYLITVVVGTNRLSDYEARMYFIDHMVFHDDWSMDHMTNDIGMIHVKEDIEFNDKVQKVKLPEVDFQKSSCYPATVTGWGMVRRGHDTSSDELQEIILKVIRQCICKRKYTFVIEINESHLCTYTKIGEGTCRGDSGSPLVADGVQIGIVSAGAIPCATGKPDVFTRVYTFLDWIDAEQAKYKNETNFEYISSRKNTNAITHND